MKLRIADENRGSIIFHFIFSGIGGAKFISFEDRHWHNDCFVCAQCSTSLVGKGFITDAADILCPECAKARLMAVNS